ncbi:MAG: hypothetical protein Q8O74_10120, partial [bacterium]|nr:hypothetical protein [bacterium]
DNWFRKLCINFTDTLIDASRKYEYNLDTVISYPEKYEIVKIRNRFSYLEYYIVSFRHSLIYAKGYTCIALIAIENNTIKEIFKLYNIAIGDVFIGYKYLSMFNSDIDKRVLILLNESGDDYPANLIYSFDPDSVKVSKVLDYYE